MHYNPDGDAVGAAVALYGFLTEKGVECKILSPNDIPEYLTWITENTDLHIYSNNNEKGNRLINDADAIFSIDYNAFHRVKLFEENLTNYKGKKFLIDHHIDPQDGFDFYYSDTNVSSTAELVYIIIQELNKLLETDTFTKKMAESIFVGIMTDTGSFSYSCNNSETFSTVAELIKYGVDVNLIHRKVYDTFSENRMRLLGYCLTKRMKVLPEYHTAYIWLTEEDLRRFHYKPGDTEGVVNFALSIKDISFAALLTQRTDRVRISLRSKGDFSVNDVANEHFNGGGHKNASGGDIFTDIYTATQQFESILPQYLDKIKKSLDS